MDKIKEVAAKAKGYVVNDEEKQEQSFREEISGLCPSLTYKQRLCGFGICFSVGWFCSIISFFTIRNPRKFAVLYTFSALLSIGSTMFLSGPASQFKKMFEDHRFIATIIYLISMGVTLYLAFTDAKVVFVLLAVLVQFLAMLWYCLTYVPFGRKMATKCAETCLI